MLILDHERHKRRGIAQENAQVNFEAAKRASIGIYYRCNYTSVHTLTFNDFLISRYWAVDCG